jgi:hypothetical protein
MSDLIQPQEIPGGAVYGVKQYEYTVDGVSGKDYSAALAVASFRQSVAIENSAAAYSEVVRQRERKVSDLGVVLSAIAQAIATMDPKSQDTGKRSSWSAVIYTASQTCARYGISLPLVAVKYEAGEYQAQVTYRDATKAQNDIQYALDKEDNNLQQDMVNLQSYISKRDNAYTNAAKIVRKADGTAAGTIRNIT